jgi:hypothetical protein
VSRHHEEILQAGFGQSNLPTFAPASKICGKPDFFRQKKQNVASTITACLCSAVQCEARGRASQPDFAIKVVRRFIVAFPSHRAFNRFFEKFI